MSRRRLLFHQRHPRSRRVKVSTWQSRWLIRGLALLAMPIAFLAWTAIGLVSMRQLGSVLRQVGENLEEYDW